MPERDLRRGLVIAVEGPSGAGKSSVTQRLAPLLGATRVAEAYDRLGRSVSLVFRGRDELADLERQLLREEGRRWTEARDLRALGASAVLDTATFGPLTYAWGYREGVDGAIDVVLELARTVRRMAGKGDWGLPDLTIYLDVPEGLARTRAKLDPRAHPSETAERHAAVGRWERVLYSRELPRRLPGRFLSVSGEGTAGEVALAIQERLERFGPLPPATPEETDRFLRLFETGGAAPAELRPSTGPAPKRSADGPTRARGPPGP